MQIANAVFATQLFDFVRRNKLPMTVKLLPDAGQALVGADGVMGGTDATVLHAAGQRGGVMTEDAGREGATGVTLSSRIKAPTSVAAAHANTSRWFLTILVVAQRLPLVAPFKMGPQATRAYLGILWQAALFRGMTLDRYLVYRNESLRTMTERYNAGAASMDVVLAHS